MIGFEIVATAAPTENADLGDVGELGDSGALSATAGLAGGWVLRLLRHAARGPGAGAGSRQSSRRPPASTAESNSARSTILQM